MRAFDIIGKRWTDVVLGTLSSALTRFSLGNSSPLQNAKAREMRT
jgi:DNA-binding HxlR family transcriptional regulator